MLSNLTKCHYECLDALYKFWNNYAQYECFLLSDKDRPCAPYTAQPQAYTAQPQEHWFY